MPRDAGLSFDRRRAPRGLALRDVITAIAVAGVLLSLASVSMPRFRSGAMLEECIDNQREMSAGSGAFALANNDLFAGLTWMPGNQTSQYADLRFQATQGSPATHAAQVVDFWRRRGLTFIPPINGWFPDNLFTTVALVEFLNKDLTDPFNVCPSDANQMAWRLDPVGFNAGAFLPNQPAGGGANARWPYGSSYLATASAIDPLQSDPNAILNLRLTQLNTHNVFSVPGSNPFGPSPLASVAHPSGKVFLFDFADRHFATSAMYFAFPDTVLPAAFFDGAVRVVQSERANVAWYPSNPAFQSGQFYDYTPNPWNPPGGGRVTDPFRYTRDGLRGIDFPPLSRVRGATAGRTR